MIDIGQLVYDIVCNDISKSGLDSAKEGFVVTAGDIVAALNTVNTKVQDMAEDYAQHTGSAERVAAISGIQADTVKELAKNYTDAATPMGDVLIIEEGLAKQHVTSAEQMDRLIPQWEKFKNANQLTAQEIFNNTIPAFKAFGIDADHMPQKFDMLTALFSQTDVSSAEFSQTMKRLGPALQDTGLSMDQVSGVLLTMNKHGIDGRTGLDEFKKALESTEGQGFKGAAAVEEINRCLKLNNAEVDTNQQFLENQTGSMETFNQATEDSYTGSQKMTAEISKQTEVLGPYADALSPIVSMMTKLGEAYMGWLMIKSIFGGNIGKALGGGAGGAAGAGEEAAAGGEWDAAFGLGVEGGTSSLSELIPIVGEIVLASKLLVGNTMANDELTDGGLSLAPSKAGYTHNGDIIVNVTSDSKDPQALGSAIGTSLKQEFKQRGFGST